MKAKHLDAILLFRVGDFYETFSEDAIATSDILGITLTRRASNKEGSVELAGFPHHALDVYLPRLVRAGKRVAICERLEDPKCIRKTKEGKVTGIVTPCQMEIPTSREEDTLLITSFTLILSAFLEILKQLHLFQKIVDYGKEIRSLAKEIGISPLKAFEESKEHIVQPNLFD